MSIRTLVEFNHDFLYEIEGDPEAFVFGLIETLNGRGDDYKYTSSYNVKWTRHYTDPCPVEQELERRGIDPNKIVRT